MKKYVPIIMFAMTAATVVAAAAQTYPSRPITMIAPFSAGGPTDVVARIVAEHMSRTLGQQVTIENVVGAGGTTGSARTMRASPDGYTIQIAHMGTHAISVSLYPNLAYRPDVDFEPIGEVVEQPFLILAKKDFPPRDLKEFLPYVKANADRLNVAHAGVGSLSFTYCLLLDSIIDARPTLVPFNGTAPAMNALIGGQVDILCDAISNVVPQVEGGTIKAYAVGSDARNPALPTIPTAKEAGLPEFRASAWYGLFAPRGTPPAVLDKLSVALDHALDDDGVRKRFIDLGCDIPAKAARGRASLAALVKRDIALWTPIMRAANIKGE
jgi:tripartite-type tricarboxylate transporter receptor subunit TctC